LHIHLHFLFIYICLLREEFKKMKHNKIVFLFIISIIAVLFLSSCYPGIDPTNNNEPDVISSTSPQLSTYTVILDKTSERMAVGGETSLTATVEKDGKPFADSIEWITSNSSVATVSSTGHVKAIAPGDAKITARSVSSRAGRIFTASVRRVEIFPIINEVSPGDSIVLSAVLTTHTETEAHTGAHTEEPLRNEDLTWSVISGSGATVTKDSNGEKLSIDTNATPGSKITVRARLNELLFSDKEYTVIALPAADVSVVRFDQASPRFMAVSTTAQAMGEEPNFDLSTTVLTSDGSQLASLGKTVTYTSSNTSVATVDANTGEVTAHALGDAVITATVVDNNNLARAAVAESADFTVHVRSLDMTPQGDQRIGLGLLSEVLGLLDLQGLLDGVLSGVGGLVGGLLDVVNGLTAGLLGGLLDGLLGDLADGVLNNPLDSDLEDALNEQFNEEHTDGVLSSLLGNNELELTAKIMGGSTALQGTLLDWDWDDNTNGLLTEPTVGGKDNTVEGGKINFDEGDGLTCRVSVEGKLLGLDILNFGYITVTARIPNSNIVAEKRVNIFSLLEL
jgi:hypothetical protein